MHEEGGNSWAPPGGPISPGAIAGLAGVDRSPACEVETVARRTDRQEVIDLDRSRMYVDRSCMYIDFGRVAD